MRIENGRFKVITTRPLDYEVSMDPQDPHNPPTKPVFLVGNGVVPIHYVPGTLLVSFHLDQYVATP